MHRSSNEQSRRRELIFWRIAALLSATVFLTLCWILFDTLFAITEGDMGQRVEIPDFKGMREETIVFPAWIDAESEYRYDDTAPAGVVISQKPMAGSLRKLSDVYPKCAVTLVVSLGQARATLKNVVGMDVRNAITQLKTAGFTVQTVMRTGREPEGTVLAMQPRSGEEIPHGTQVVLTVSTGPFVQTVTVPDFRGLTRAEALLRIGLAQLAVGNVIEAESNDPAGTVFRQSHQAGTVVMAGTRITLYVSSEKKQGESDVSG